MESSVIIKNGLNHPPMSEVNENLSMLSKDWKATQAATTATVVPNPGNSNGYDVLYITTVILQKG